MVLLQTSAFSVHFQCFKSSAYSLQLVLRMFTTKALWSAAIREGALVSFPYALDNSHGPGPGNDT